jgi:hypothetical protein
MRTDACVICVTIVYTSYFIAVLLSFNSKTVDGKNKNGLITLSNIFALNNDRFTEIRFEKTIAENNLSSTNVNTFSEWNVHVKDGYRRKRQRKMYNISRQIINPYVYRAFVHRLMFWKRSEVNLTSVYCRRHIKRVIYRNGIGFFRLNK